MRSIFPLFCLITFFSSITAKIIECDHFKEIVSYASPDALLVLDIDDTLLIPVQMLGCDEWFQYRLDLYKKQDMSGKEALEKALAEWEAVRHLTQMEVVEAETEEVIEQLQKNQVAIMGLTTQGLALATRTQLQLLEQNIDLSKTAPSKEDSYFCLSGHGILYRHGILFTSGQNKGEAFFQFCDLISYCPKKVVFINDKYSHLRELEEAAESRSVEFVGLRYSYSDMRKQKFSADIAEYQFSHSSLPGWLSDEEAMNFMQEPSLKVESDS